MFQTREPERSANWLLQRFTHVMVWCHPEFAHSLSIRFRGDMLKGDHVYFDRVKSQVERWKETGGSLITWSREDPPYKVFGRFDAIVIQECPTRATSLHTIIKNVDRVCVIYNRPNWDKFEEAIRVRRAYSPGKMVRRMDELRFMQQLVGGLPVFSRENLDRIPRAPEAESQLLSAPESPEAEARSPDTTY